MFWPDFPLYYGICITKTQRHAFNPSLLQPKTKRQR